MFSIDYGWGFTKNHLFTESSDEKTFKTIILENVRQC